MPTYLEYDFSYDRWSQLTSVVDQADAKHVLSGLATRDVNWTLSWDPTKRGDLTSISATVLTNPTSGTSYVRAAMKNSYTYDNLRRTTSITQEAISGTYANYAQLLASSNLESKLKQVSIAYNQAGQMKQIVRSQSNSAGTAATEVVTSDYNYYGNGGLKSIEHYNQLTAGKFDLSKYEWQYDSDNRVSKLIAPEGEFAYVYDPQDQLLASLFTPKNATNGYLATQLSENFAGYDANTQTYNGYDPNGNPDDLGAATAAENELTDSGQDPNFVLDTDENRYSLYYDFEGNLIRRVQRIESTSGTFTEGIVQKYYYDHRNRMIKVENFATPNDATATIPRPSYKVDYGYDAFDRRVYKVTTSYTYATNGTIATTRVTVQRFVWLLDHVQMELNQRGEVTDRYLNGPMVDQVFANEAAAATVSGVTYAGGLMWLLGDNQNTVRDVVMRSGTDTSSVTIHRTYSAFGRITTETTPTNGAAGTLGTSVNLTTTPNTDIAYTGRDLDRTTGFQYHRARWYSPLLRRFTQKDPWGWGGGDTNLYRYVGNSPNNATDPSGFKTKKEWQEQALNEIGQRQGAKTQTTDILEINNRINAAYARMYLCNKKQFIWAGLAALASSKAGGGMKDAQKGSSVSSVGKVFVPLYGEGAKFFAENLREGLAKGNMDVYADIYWQFLAYRDGGINELRRLNQTGELPKELLYAWELINKGDSVSILEGNRILLKHEQKNTLGDGAYKNYEGTFYLASKAASGAPNLIESPVPGHDVPFAKCVPGGNLANFEDRWKWIESSIWPAWQNFVREKPDEVIRLMKEFAKHSTGAK